MQLGVTEDPDLCNLSGELNMKVHERTDVWIQQQEQQLEDLEAAHHAQDEINLSIPATLEDTDNVDEHCELRDAIIEELFSS